MSIAEVPIARRGISSAELAEKQFAAEATQTSSVEIDSIPLGQRFALNSIDWHSYRTISETLTGRHLRITYDRGRLELMTISSLHGTLCRLIYSIISVLTEEFQLPQRSCGDMACDHESLARGIEPDECFYIENEALVRNKDNIDLAIDPPPDLAVEVNVSRDSRRRLAIYAALGVPEVWRYDGQSLTIYVRTPEAEYAEVECSPHFPGISGQEVEAALSRRLETDRNGLVRLFRARVRELRGPTP